MSTVIRKIRRRSFDSVRRWYDKSKPFIESHRGCNREEDENTIPAFKKAIEYGCDSIELDVWLTKDLIPVVIHGGENGTISETTNGDGKAADHTFEQISKFTTNKNKYQIPSLEEVLIVCKDNIFVNIEIKDKDTIQCMIKIVELVHKFDIRDQIAISTFENNHWEEMKKISDNYCIELGYLYDNTENKTVVYEYDENKRNSTINIWYQGVTQEFVHNAHSNNIAVHCWFCMNDDENEEVISYLIQCGVDVICSNSPREAIEIRDRIFCSV
jgi:glycerophosphoryl diester phosphodiesterase